jgi:hypothetical protein
MTVPMPVAAHLGSLHGYETVLLALLAFGPFVVLAVVVLVLRRRDLADDEVADAPPPTMKRRNDS